MSHFNFNRKFFVLSAVLAMGVTAQANAVNAKKKVKFVDDAPVKQVAIENEDDYMIDADTFSKLKKEAIERSTRTVASASVESPELTAFRNRFLNVADAKTGQKPFPKFTAEVLDMLLAEADSADNFTDKKPNDLKFVAAQFAVLRVFKSFVYRVRPYTENATVVHSALLSMVRNSIASMNIFLPTAQWSAISDYLTQPMVGMGEQFEHTEDLREFYGTTVYKALGRARKRIRVLDLTQPIVWDNQFLYGSASFVDGLDRYRNIGKAEQFATMAGIDAALSQIAFSMAYSPKNTINVIEDLGTLYGVDSIASSTGTDKLFGTIQGAPSRDRVHTIKKYKEFGVLTDAGWLQWAGKFFNNSIYEGQVAWAEIKSRPASDFNVMDPAVYNVYNRQISLGSDNLEKLATGNAVVKSQVTGETRTVVLNNFFNEKTAVKDLKDLLPTHFNEQSSDLSKDVNGKSVSYRNYAEGKADSWNYGVYKRFFPDIRTDTAQHGDADVQACIRILSQVYGNGASAVVFGGLIL